MDKKKEAERIKSNFNSTQVRLEAEYRHGATVYGVYFNSTQVRLEVKENFRRQGILNKFQFHSGTIRSSICILKSVLQDYFNSTQVRLEVRIE